MADDTSNSHLFHITFPYTIHVIKWLVNLEQSVTIDQPLLYYQNTSDKKYQSLLSPHNGIILEISSLSLIESEKNIITLDICPHDIIFGDFCVVCSRNINLFPFRSQNSTNTTQNSNEISRKALYYDRKHQINVSKEAFSQLSRETGYRLLNDSKLCLVLDLDQTIVQACKMATNDNEYNEQIQWVTNHLQSKESLFDYFPKGSRYPHFIKLRPGALEFLQNLSQYYEMSIFTMGQKEYAEKILNFIDPTHLLFQDRFLTRDDIFQIQKDSLQYKDISLLVPAPVAMTVIVDDSPSMWLGSMEKYVLRIHPYHFWPSYIHSSSSINDSNSKNQDHEDNEVDDNLLSTLSSLLEIAYHVFYSFNKELSSSSSDLSLNPPLSFLDIDYRWKHSHDIGHILSLIRCDTLKNVVIVFSHVFDHNIPIEKQYNYILATSYGAIVKKDINDETTHLVTLCTQENITDKIRIVKKKYPNIFIVNLKWLWACCAHYHHINEQSFLLFPSSELPPKKKKRSVDKIMKQCYQTNYCYHQPNIEDRINELRQNL